MKQHKYINIHKDIQVRHFIFKIYNTNNISVWSPTCKLKKSHILAGHSEAYMWEK